MNKQEYNNVIGLSVQKQSGTNDSLQITREALNNMGVVLPQGDLKQVSDGLATDNYMGWRKCTVKEAQEYANEGTAVVAVSEDKIALVAANEDEGKVAANSSAVMTLDENTPALAVADMAFYANSRSGTTMWNKESVKICLSDDGGYVDVIFGNGRKVWNCLFTDMLHRQHTQPFDVLSVRSDNNFWKNQRQGIVQTYSVQELKLLFTVDPYGVADYIYRYCKEFESGSSAEERLLSNLVYKDLFFLNLFDREPEYYQYSYNNWVRVSNVTEALVATGEVYSESEALFGAHEYGIDDSLGTVFLALLEKAARRAFPLIDLLFESYDEATSLYELSVAVDQDLLEDDYIGAGTTVVNEMLSRSMPGWANEFAFATEMASLIQTANINAGYTRDFIKYCAYHHNYDMYVDVLGGQPILLRQLLQN